MDAQHTQSAPVDAPVTAPDTTSKPKPSIGEKTLTALGKVWTVVSADMRLRALLGGTVTGLFAFLGMHVDGETAISMITAAALLAGIGPHEKAGQ